jgi:methionyl-tRNA formyltransferase
VPSPNARSTHEPIRALAPPPPLPADVMLQTQTQPNLIQLAWAQHIPVFEISSARAPETFTTLTALQPDVILVACFPFILPRRLLRLPRHGSFNLHPSLLPKLRGPAPLFWVFHEGAHAGVTLHAMNEHADAGDVVAQTPLVFPDGITYADADRMCARAGAELMRDALRAIEHSTLTTRPQRESDVSYFSNPTPADFIITPNWSARRAYNFICGVAGFGGPVVIQVDDKQFVVREAAEYKMGETMAEVHRVEGDRLRVRCADGVLQVRGEWRA